MAAPEPRRSPASSCGWHSACESEPRRVANAALAVVVVVLLTGGAAVAYLGGQMFLAVIGGIGALLTIWALVTPRKAA